MYELQFIDAVPLYGPTLRVHTEVGGDLEPHPPHLY